MRFVAILSTVADLTSPDSIQAHLPDEYPVMMVEFEAESLDEAKMAYPDKTVLAAEEYNADSTRLAEIFEQAKTASEKVPWWKFW